VSWAGLGVVALFVVNLLSIPASELLEPGLSAGRLAELYRQHRDATLFGIYVAGLTWGGMFLVFAGMLSKALSDAGSGAQAWIGLAGAAVESAAILMFSLLSSTAVFVAGSAEPSTVSMLHGGSLLANNLSGFPTIVCVGAYTLGGRRAGIFPLWVTIFGVLCVAAHAVSTLSLASSGPLSPAGPAGMIAPVTMAAWVLGVSVAVRRV
jgi:hypothetical protein